MLSKSRQIKVFGLTGGIAAGKSEVARVLRAAGFPVLDADAIARAQSRRGGAAFDLIVAEFGQGVVGADGELDRAAIGRMVFADPELRVRLESLTHRPVLDEVERRVAVLASMGQPAAVIEAALIVEVGLDASLDGLIVVIAPEEARVRRAVARDGVTEADVRTRVAAQTDDAARLVRATEVIQNDGSLSDLRERAAAVALRLAFAAARRRGG